ncbi:MAG TPA: response regulator [Verrucomicrobiae bacterium]|nr:response regulator [Verrucomicrobiae bacterium]
MSIWLPKKILAVDDNPVILKATQQILQKSGYEVLQATDGPEAVSAARTEKPDLILLDLSFPPDPMSGPLADGFDVIEWLHRMPESKNIPIIIISDTPPSQYKSRFTEGEIAGFYQKPLDKKQMLAAIEAVLGEN